jgi:hypothetical protein
MVSDPLTDRLLGFGHGPTGAPRADLERLNGVPVLVRC